MLEQLIAFLTEHYLLSAAWLLCSILIILSYIQGARSGSLNLSTQQATQLMNRKDAIILDIRPAATFRKGHIIDSVNVSADKIDTSLKELEKYKNTPIIVACANGIQANSAALKLRKAGFAEVHKLKGGVQGWQAENLPLQVG